MGMLLLLTLVIAGCGDKKESNIKVGNEVYSLGKEKDTKEEEAKKNESEQKTYAVIEIDTEKQLIRLQNTKSGKISDYGYSDGTEFRDKYGGLTGVEKMLPGRIVKIGETRENGAVSLIQLSDEAWEQENVERFSMKQDQQMITVGKTKYYYDDSHYGTNEANNIAYYEVGDKINIIFSHREGKIITVNFLELIYNSHDPEKLKGDVNADGVVNVADIVLLQNWFLNVSGIYLPDWKAADMNEDDVLNVLDLCFLGQEIISSGNI